MDLCSETLDLVGPAGPTDPVKPAKWGLLMEPVEWIRMLCRRLNGSFVLGVVLVNGLNRGFAGSFSGVVTDYYWKDVQKVQPSTVQLLVGFYYIPWILKPVWGLLTDVFPVFGYRRRPYFILAGVLGASAALIVSMSGTLPIIMALLCIVGLSAAVAIADVTIDACIARNSIEQPSLAADMQSLCGFVSSVGALIGSLSSGVCVHSLGAQGALGILAIPPSSLVVLGFVMYEPRNDRRSQKKKLMENLGGAIGGMGRTIKCPQVWKPTLFMFLSIALSFSTHEGHFYWYTDAKAGPAFSQEFVGIIYAIGALASIVGVLIYHKLLKEYPFRSLLFHAQLLYGVSGMLDLIFVLRWNLKLGIPDYVFVILEECCIAIIGRIRWMPMLVLSTKLCPLGIEGTFFALLMCIDSLGSLSSKTAGGIMLAMFHVTRTDFRNLWLVVLIRNLLRFATLGLIFLVPKANQLDTLLPPEVLKSAGGDEETLQLTSMNERDEEYTEFDKDKTEARKVNGREL